MSAYCDLPDEVRTSLAERQRLRATLSEAAPDFEFTVSDVDAWAPGGQLRVAFLGGPNDLLLDLEALLGQISRLCNLRFQTRDARGDFIAWSTSDSAYAAEIRVSFDRDGCWSLIGRDSVNALLTPRHSDFGGRPNQRSLNLARFDIARPLDWRGTALHEFLHALGVHHEHQNLRGPCQEDFRWEDEAGYVVTSDARGRYVPDGKGRRPGIYTYLSGEPNRWSRRKVDVNLRADPTANLRSSAFDRQSVMLYRFDDLFYASAASECRPLGDGQALSSGDSAALESLYPLGAAAIGSVIRRKQALISQLEGIPGFESVDESSRRARWADRVRASLP
jgi:hypothetical protein